MKGDDIVKWLHGLLHISQTEVMKVYSRKEGMIPEIVRYKIVFSSLLCSDNAKVVCLRINIPRMIELR